MEEKVVVYKFFQGKFTVEHGVKKLSPYGKFLGIIYILGKTKRGVTCAKEPGVIRNNFIWYPIDEENSMQKALSIFKEREFKMWKEHQVKFMTCSENLSYLDAFIYAEHDKDVINKILEGKNNG